MTKLKHKAARKETKRFAFVGLAATTVDYSIYNLITGLFQGPLILGNVASTSVASLVSFFLNREVVFDGERQDRRRWTILLYVAIIAVSIYVIQSVVLYVVHEYLPHAGVSVQQLASQLGMGGISDRVWQNNFAKVCASFVGAIWNFFMLRRFVFVPLTENPQKHVS